jgi:hypothetical protein
VIDSDSDSTYFTGRTAARTRTRTITSTLIYPAPGPAAGAETGMIDAMHYIDAETTNDDDGDFSGIYGGCDRDV